MSTVHSPIDQHPDLLAMRAGYERAAESMGAYAAFGMTLLAGLYVAASPWIVGFELVRRLTWSDVFAGIAVAVLAYGLATALDRVHGLSWTVPVLGGWIIISPWVLSGFTPVTPGMAWSQVVGGAIVTCLGLAATYYGMRTRVGTSPTRPTHNHHEA